MTGQLRNKFVLFLILSFFAFDLEAAELIGNLKWEHGMSSIEIPKDSPYYGYYAIRFKNKFDNDLYQNKILKVLLIGNFEVNKTFVVEKVAPVIRNPLHTK